jgi:hypothetical protein
MTRWERFYYGSIAVAIILFLGGCAGAKIVYDTCREGLCR